jgi:hypothetical protein
VPEVPRDATQKLRITILKYTAALGPEKTANDNLEQFVIWFPAWSFDTKEIGYQSFARATGARS